MVKNNEKFHPWVMPLVFDTFMYNRVCGYCLDQYKRIKILYSQRGIDSEWQRQQTFKTVMNRLHLHLFTVHSQTKRTAGDIVCWNSWRRAIFWSFVSNAVEIDSPICKDAFAPYTIPNIQIDSVVCVFFICK